MMELRELLESRNVIKTGHFKLSSGKHSYVYINKDDIYSDAFLYNLIVNMMCSKIGLIREYFDIITGPAIAGAVLASPISINLGKIFVYPEKKNEVIITPTWTDQLHINHTIKNAGMEFRRGYDEKIKGCRVVIVEDIITTGKSVQQTIDAIKLCGGDPIKVLAIWNRTGWNSKDITSPTDALINEWVDSWDKNDCPLCKKSIELTNPKTGEKVGY